MAETKREPVRMPSFDDLDDYEKELCQSADPADHTALLMRIALKGIGIDPDGDDWYVSGHKMESSDPNLVIEEQKLRYRPVVKKLHVLKPVTGRTFIQGKTKGELKLTKLMFPDLGSNERVIECDIHGWEEATMPDADHNVYCSKCMGGPTMSSLERARIAKSVRDDADTASMEELEAASDILDQADKMLSGLENVDIAYEPIIEDNSIEDVEEIDEDYKNIEERIYDENYRGLFFNKKSKLVHSLHIGWFSGSDYSNYWRLDCGGLVSWAGGNSMMDKGCHGPGEEWVDLRDFAGDYEMCKKCRKILEKRHADDE